MDNETKQDKFRPRSPSYQRWTPTVAEEDKIAKSWEEMLNGPLGLNKMKSEDIVGYRIQVNFKRTAKVRA